MIEICLAATGNYAPFVATVALSLTDNSKRELRFHILAEKFSDDEKDKLVRFLKDGRHNVDIEFIDIDQHLHLFVGCPTAWFRTSIIYARILAPELLPAVDKCIYMDTDMIVRCDVQELWNIDLESKWSVAAAPDLVCENLLNLSKTHRYFNSGLLIIDCKKWRKNNIPAQLLQKAQSYQNLKYPDQDLLNLFFENNYKLLDNCYNSAPFLNKNTENYNPKIIHYLMEKPWETKDCFYSEIFWHYAEQTPYYEQIKRMLRINTIVLNRQSA